MENVVRDGLVAVLFSPGYGAGWYTWNRDHPECLFDPDTVAWVEGGKTEAMPDWDAKYGDAYFYSGGASDLMIKWLPQGTQFRISEYDGYETVVLAAEEVWMIS